MKTTTKISALIFALAMIACGEPSLEKYYVNNQEKDNFVVLNIPSSMFVNTDTVLSKKEKATLKSIEKANILVYPLTEGANTSFEKEKTKLGEILKDEKYTLLMKMGSSGKQFRLMYLGEPGSIDELIVYGYSDEIGFGVARILGDDMDPEAMIELAKSLKNSDNLNFEGIKGLEAVFPQKESE